MEVAKGNWVGYRTLFFNQKTQQYSEHINQVINYNNTRKGSPIRRVWRLYFDYPGIVYLGEPLSRMYDICCPINLFIWERTDFNWHETQDQTLELLGVPSSEDAVLEQIGSAVNGWASGFSEDILIPTQRWL